MIFAAGIVVVGGVLLIQKFKARRQISGQGHAARGEALAPIPATDLPVSAARPTPFLAFERVPIEQHLLLSGGALGLRIISIAGVPFAGPFSIASLLYLDLYFLHRAYVEWKTEGVSGVTDAVVATGLLMTRQFGADALFATTFFISRKLTQDTKATLVQRLSDSTLLARQPTQSAPSSTPEIFAEETAFALTKAGLEATPKQMMWQTLIQRGAVPFLTLSTLSLPFLGVKRSLAVLLTNFGYDYRVTAPLSTLTHMDLAAQHDIVIGDWHAFEKLSQVDVVVLDEQFFSHAITTQNGAGADDPALANLPLLQQLQQAGKRKWVLIRKAPMMPESAPLLLNITTIAPHEAPALLKQLHATKRTVCLVRGEVDLVMASGAADSGGATDSAEAAVVVTMCDPQTILTSPAQLAHAKAQIGLSTGNPEQLLTLFQLADHLALTLKRGLALTLVPSMISLGGIYLFHFGPLSALLLDSTALAAGVVNAKWAHLSSQPTSSPLREMNAASD